MDFTVERDSLCFCCGKDNKKGLRLTISYPEKGAAETRLTVPEYFQGWRKLTHGGFLSTILDEVMAHACLGIARHAVTAEITVKFQKPVETGSRIHAVGRVTAAKGKLINTQGWIYDESGGPAAEAMARFIVVSADPDFS
jgi:uncharacterized protein (TIGR00369 family)